MVAKELFLSNEWVDIYTELGVENTNDIFIQNKSNGPVYLWPKNSLPVTNTDGAHLSTGSTIVMNAQGERLYVKGYGNVFVSQVTATPTSVNISAETVLTVDGGVDITNDDANPVPVTFPSAPTVNIGIMPAVVTTPQNITTEFRESFEYFNPASLTSPWTLSLAEGDIAIADGNAVAAKYLVLSKSPWSAGTVTSIESKVRFKTPFEAVFGLHMSQRVLGQEFSIEVIDDSTITIDSDISIASMTHASGLLTINTAANHNLVPGKRFQIRGCADNRFNYSSLVVASAPAPNQITATAGPGGTLGAIVASATNGFICPRPALGYAANGTSMTLEAATATTASFYIRNTQGESLPSGTLIGNHSLTTLSSASVQAINSAYTYAFQPTAEYRLTQQPDRIQWSNVAIDSISQSASLVAKTQVVPDPSVQYKLRIRATNARDLSRPVGKIISAVKSGSTTATLTLDREHGLVTGAFTTVYGIRDQSAAAFPNIAVATAITGVPAPNQVQIVIGTGTANTSYGGFVSVVNGGNLQSALGASAQVIQSASLSTLSTGVRQLTLVGTASWASPTATIGDYVEVIGVRTDGTGADLRVDGAWKIANVATTTLTLVPVISSMTLPVDFASTNCGGSLMRRTDLRLSFIRVFDFTRERVESLPRPSGDAAYGAPVAVQGGTLATVSSVTAVTTAGTPAAPVTPYFVNSLASTNGALILTGTSGLQAFFAANVGASDAWVKLYNKATAPTVGTDVPEMVIRVPANGQVELTPGFNGYRFTLGLGIAITGASSDSDTTAVAAGQVKVKLSRTV